MNVVFAEWVPCGKTYIYALPKGYKVRTGERIIVPDKLSGGEAKILAVCDSATLPESMVDVIMGAFGSSHKDIVYAVGKIIDNPQEIRFSKRG